MGKWECFSTAKASCCFLPCALARTPGETRCREGKQQRGTEHWCRDPLNNWLVTNTRAGLDMADAALGYLHPTLHQPAASEPNPQGYRQIKARCRADGRKYGGGGGLALASSSALCPPHSWRATFWAEVVQSPPCGARRVMGGPGGSSSGWLGIGSHAGGFPRG